MPPPASRLESALRAHLENRAQHSRLRQLPAPLPSPSSSSSSSAPIDFSSNDYISLSTSARFRQTFLAELSAHPAHPLGSGGSRLLDGNSLYATRLEADVARHHHADPAGALLFNSGFEANTAFFATVPQSGDTVLFDADVHASVWEGMRKGRARTRAFAHNDVRALRQALAEVVRERREAAEPEPEPTAGGAAKEGRAGGTVFVAVESVYSMDGSLAPLAQMLAAADELLPDGGALFVVDEAHATGVIGPGGRGLVCALGLEERVFCRLHTFGKALACNGAIVLCTPVVKHYLVNYARPLIYTTAAAFPQLAAVRAAYTLLWSGATAALQDELARLITLVHARLHENPTISTRPSSSSSSSSSSSGEAGQILAVSPLQSLPTPVLALLTPRPRALAACLRHRGILARPIVFPTVARGQERVRVCVHAANTDADVDALVRCVGDWVESAVRAPRADAKSRL